MIFISSIFGLIYGVTFGDYKNINFIRFHNPGFINVFLKILIHNFLTSMIIIGLSIFIYIGPSIPVIITFFVFGDAFGAITREKGLFTAISTYPHLIPETLSILLILSIGFMISSKILGIVFKNDPINKNNNKILKNFIASCLLLILAAFVEALKLS